MKTKKYGDYRRFLSGVKQKMPYIAKKICKNPLEIPPEGHRTAQNGL